MILVALLCLVIMYAASSFIQIDLNQIISSRINDFSSDKGSGRFELWKQAITYFMSHPLLGIGAFNFSDYYAFEHNEKLYVHNTYLEILVEAGIIGFLFYFSFCYCSLSSYLRLNYILKNLLLFLHFLLFYCRWYPFLS